MKTRFFITAALAIALNYATTATPNPEMPETTRTIKLANNFSQLTLTNIKVVLTNGQGSELYITGDQWAAKKIEILTDGKELMLDGADLSKNDDVTVHISARLLEKITLQGKSEVSSNEILLNEKLDVVVSGDCKLKLKVIGKVNVSATDGYDYNSVYRKYSSEIAGTN